MISGASADERLTFVITTESNLSGIKAARTEVTGLGTDASASAQRMAAASQSQSQSIAAVANMSTKSRAAFDAMDADGKKATLSLLGVSQAEVKAALAATDHLKAVEADTQALTQQATAADKSAIALLRARDAQRAAAEAAIPQSPIATGRGAGVVGFGPQLGPALPPGGIVPSGAGDQVNTIPGKARTAANALAMLSGAALMGTGSVQGMAVAAGGLATGLAGLAASAKVAAAASGIGAIITVAGIAGAALYEMGHAAKATKEDIDHLNAFTAQTMPGQIAALRQARDTALQAVVAAEDQQTFLDRLIHRRAPGTSVMQDIADSFGISSPALRAFEKLDDLYGQAIPKSLELANNERMRVLALNDQVTFQIKSNDLELEGKHRVEDTYDLYKRQVSQLYAQIDLQKESIKHQFFARDVHGQEIALTETQIAQRQTLLDQADELGRLQLNELIHARELADIAYHNAAQVAAATTHLGGHDVKADYEARLAQINAEAKAELEQNPERAVDIEAQKQAKIRALRRETAKQAMADAKELTAVLIDSGSKQVKAVGHAAETIRRVVIGAQAAHAAVEAAIEGGKAIGSLATGDFRGAALHGAAALELAKAAALGAQESLGGGNAGGGGSGGAGGGNSQTFEPRNASEGAGVMHLTIITQNALGPDHIQNIAFQLNRSGILKQPLIEIPATTGIVVRAA